MTARTALTPVVLNQDGSVAEGSGTSIAGLVSGGAYVADFPGPNKVFLIVSNSYSSPENVTVRAGGNGNTAAGGTNPGVPFEAATVGDLVVSVTNGTTSLIGPFTSDRFTQADGSLSIDFAAALTGTIWVVQLPYGGIEP
jgi:hypothetical protein